MIRFHNQADYFELDLVMQETNKTPAEGDAYMTLKIVSAGFEGHNDLWVHSCSIRKFCRDILELAAKRQGSATIKGISPNEMEITVRSIDHSGHMAVEGFTGYEVQRVRGTQYHSVTFGIEFDPSQLNDVERVLWVKNNAEKNVDAKTDSNER